MVTIQQDYTLSNIINQLNNIDNTSIILDKDAIIEDMQRIKKESRLKVGEKRVNRAVNRKNIENITRYLGGLLSVAGDRGVELKWELVDDIIKSKPIEMRKVREYDICATDYIKLTNERIVYLDYTELADIIAFEMMYRDLGENNETIENKLEGLGITAIVDSKALTGQLVDSPYKLSRVLRVGDSPYLKAVENKLLNYFNSKEFEASSYREAVSDSCKTAMAFVVKGLIESECLKKNKVELCGVFETGISLKIGKLCENLEDKFKEPAHIRTFGRKLEVIPKINIF